MPRLSFRPAYYEDVPRWKIKAVPWSRLDNIDNCISWVEEEFLGKDGAKWVRLLVSQKSITDPRRLIECLSSVLPSYLFIDMVPVFSSVQRSIFEPFFDRYDDHQFLEAAYKIFLRRPADIEGLNHYKKLLSRGVSRSKVIRDFSASAEFTQQSDRTILTAEQLVTERKKVKLRSENLMYRIPKVIPKEFFFRKARRIGDNQTNTEWHLVIRPSPSGPMILAPGMNLSGAYNSGNEFMCSADWILFGPKINLRAGKYEFYVDFSANNDFTYILDAAADGGMSILFGFELRGSTKFRFIFNLEFDLDDLEVRILNTKLTSEVISVNSISVRRCL